MPSERLSNTLEAEIRRLRDKWPDTAYYQGDASYKRTMLRDMRKFARMVEESQADVHTEDAQGEMNMEYHNCDLCGKRVAEGCYEVIELEVTRCHKDPDKSDYTIVRIDLCESCMPHFDMKSSCDIAFNGIIANTNRNKCSG